MSLCLCLGSESFLLLPQRQASFASTIPEAMDFCLDLEARGFSALPQPLKIFAFQKKVLGKKARLACLPAAAACLCYLLHVCAVDGASLQSVTLPLTFFFFFNKFFVLFCFLIFCHFYLSIYPSIYLFIYFIIYGCVGSSFLCEGFL